MSRIKQWATGLWRLSSVLAHLCKGLWLVYIRIPKGGTDERERIIMRWSKELAHRCGIEVRTRGRAIPTGPVLWVANHISWIDVAAIHASVFAHFIAKSEIASWPVIPTLANAAGTLYIERGNRDSTMNVVNQLAAGLQAGKRLAVFLEGTTSDGSSVLHFHSRLLQAAIDTETSVQTIAISYLDLASQSRTTSPAYVNDDTLLGSIWRTLCAAPMEVVVEFGTIHASAAALRHPFAEQLREDIIALRQRHPRSSTQA